LGVGWIRRTSKLEILLHKKSTISSENDETCLEKGMRFLLECNQKPISTFELLGVGSTVGWIRRTSKFEILLHKKSTMSSETDEECLEKVM
jgi:hypothetical protein